MTKGKILQDWELLKAGFHRRIDSLFKSSIQFLEVTVALRCSGLLVQNLERFRTLGDAAVKQDYEAPLNVFSFPSKLRMFALTSWYHNPDEVHEEIISPEVIRFRPTVCKALGIMIKHARGIVKYISIDLAQGDECLERMTEGMLVSDEQCDSEGHGTPTDLNLDVLSICRVIWRRDG